MIEQVIVGFIEQRLGIANVYYQHGIDPSGSEIVWISRASEEYLDELTPEPNAFPDIVRFDVEVYAQTTARCLDLVALMRQLNNHRGVLSPSSAVCQLIEVDGQTDDYEPTMEAQDLPPHVTAAQLIVYGFSV